MSRRRSSNAASSSDVSPGYLFFQGNPQPIPLHSKFQFGRTKSFDSPKISRTHFTIALNEHGLYFILDNDSRTGTRIDGEKIKSNTWVELKEGAKIAVGPYTFTFTLLPPTQKKQKTEAANLRPVANVRHDRRAQQRSPQTAPQKQVSMPPIAAALAPSKPVVREKFPHSGLQIEQSKGVEPLIYKSIRKSSADEDSGAWLRSWLIIVATMVIAALLWTSQRKITSQEQMMPHYTAYMKLMGAYYKNFSDYYDLHRDMATYESRQNEVLRELEALQRRIKALNPVDTRADYYKKHMIYMIGKTLSHAKNTQQFLKTGRSNYFSQAKQDDAVVGKEIQLLSKAFGMQKAPSGSLPEPSKTLRLPAQNSVERQEPRMTPQTEPVKTAPAKKEKRPKKIKKARSKKKRAPGS